MTNDGTYLLNEYKIVNFSQELAELQIFQIFGFKSVGKGLRESKMIFFIHQ